MGGGGGDRSVAVAPSLILRLSIYVLGLQRKKSWRPWDGIDAVPTTTLQGLLLFSR